VGSKEQRLTSEEDTEWEEVEAGDTAENGVESMIKNAAAGEAVDDGKLKDQSRKEVTMVTDTPVLPDVPNIEPGIDGPSPKKAKVEDDTA